MKLIIMVDGFHWKENDILKLSFLNKEVVGDSIYTVQQEVWNGWSKHVDIFKDIFV